MSQPEPKKPESPLLPETSAPEPLPKEIGGAKRLEPTRYNDWELNGKCVDF